MSFRSSVSVALAALLVFFAGCTAPAEEAALAADPVAIEEVTLVDILHEGNVGLRQCAFCAGVGAEGTLYPLEFDGTAVQLVATLEWSAAGTVPVDQDFAVFLLSKVDGTWTWKSDEPMAEGASPLTIEWDLKPYGTRELALLVSTSNEFAGSGERLSVNTPRDFQLAGTLHVLPGTA